MFLPPKRNNDLLKRHLQYETELCELFQTEKINCENLLEVVEKIKNIREETLKILHLQGKHYEIKEQIVIDKIDPKLLISYRQAKDEIVSVQKQPVINLNNLISFVNLFGEIFLNSDITPLLKQEGNIIVLSDDETVPLCFKNGEKILLSCKNFDLSYFNYEHLIEILRVLDSIILDNRYDYLRSEIVRRISEIS